MLFISPHYFPFLLLTLRFSSLLFISLNISSLLIISPHCSSFLQSSLQCLSLLFNAPIGFSVFLISPQCSSFILISPHFPQLLLIAPHFTLLICTALYCSSFLLIVLQGGSRRRLTEEQSFIQEREVIPPMQKNTKATFPSARVSTAIELKRHDSSFWRAQPTDTAHCRHTADFCGWTHLLELIYDANIILELNREYWSNVSLG